MKNSTTNNSADVTYPVHELIAERWSPRAFADATVDSEVIGSLLEAARWAPSCFNAQPWRFVVVTRDDEAGFERLACCLVDGNVWAKQAPVLILSVAQRSFEHNGKPNRWAQHDVGLAVENLVLQAQAMGLGVHQMAGFDADKARELFAIPDDFEPIAVAAVGYPGEADSLPEELAQRERAPRERKSLSAIAFGSVWGESLALGEAQGA